MRITSGSKIKLKDSLPLPNRINFHQLQFSRSANTTGKWHSIGGCFVLPGSPSGTVFIIIIRPRGRANRNASSTNSKSVGVVKLSERTHVESVVDVDQFEMFFSFVDLCVHTDENVTNCSHAFTHQTHLLGSRR